MVPERTQVYNLCIASEDAEKIIKCHGYYCNLMNVPTDVEPLVADWLPKFLMDFEPVFDSKFAFENWDEKDPKTNIKQQKPFVIAGFELEATVVVTGFIL